MPEDRVRSILGLLADEGVIPAWAADLPCIQWHGDKKDLRFVVDADPRFVLLVDDQECYIIPEQHSNWVAVKEFVAPYPEDDAELEVVVVGLVKRRGIAPSTG